MNDRIMQSLTKLFERYRIVFWHDEQRELRQDFTELALPDVVKLEIANNEYQIKYRILREVPDQKFLLYREGPRLDDMAAHRKKRLRNYSDSRLRGVNVLKTN